MRRCRSGPFALLVMSLVALVLAHHAIYVVSGEGKSASAAGDSDAHAYWRSAELLVALAAGGLLATAVRQLLRLRRQARQIERGRAIVPESGLRYLRQLFVPGFLRVTALTTVLFVLQENIERGVIGARLPGLFVLVPANCRLAVLLIVAASAAVALVASLVRWRTLVLRARVRAASFSRPRANTKLPLRQPQDLRPVARLQAAGLGMRAPPLGAAT